MPNGRKGTNASGVKRPIVFGVDLAYHTVRELGAEHTHQLWVEQQVALANADPLSGRHGQPPVPPRQPDEFPAAQDIEIAVDDVLPPDPMLTDYLAEFKA